MSRTAEYLTETFVKEIRDAERLRLIKYLRDMEQFVKLTNEPHFGFGFSAAIDELEEESNGGV